MRLRWPRRRRRRFCPYCVRWTTRISAVEFGAHIEEHREQETGYMAALAHVIAAQRHPGKSLSDR